MEAPSFVIDDHSLVSDIPHKYRDALTLHQSSYNIYPAKGGLSSRWGWSLLVDAPDNKSIIGLNGFQASDGIYHVVVATTDTLYSAVSTDGFSSLASLKGANASLTAADTNAGVFANYVAPGFKGGVVFTNNQNMPISWKVGDTSWTVINGANAPSSARTVAISNFGVAGNRVMFGNTVEGGTRYGSRVRWSALNDPATYVATAYADLLATQDNIVAMLPFQQGIVIYKENSVWYALPQAGQDAAAFQFQLIDVTKPGPVGTNAICQGPDGTHVYLGRDGNLYIFNGSYVSLLYRLSDISNLYFDTSRIDNCSLLYDFYENVIKIYAILSVSGTTLVLVSTNGLTNLIIIVSNPGISGLVLFLSYTKTNIFYFDIISKQIYFGNIPTEYLRYSIFYSAINSYVNIAALGKHLAISNSSYDSALSQSSMQIKLDIQFPMLANNEWEFDGFDIQLDGNQNSISITINYGDNDEAYNTAVVYTGTTTTNRLKDNGINLRGKYMAFVIQGNLFYRLIIRRIELSAWKRRSYE